MKKRRPRRKSAFAKWQDGETHIVTIQAEMPKERLQHWDGGASYECTGEDCAYCKEGFQPRSRWQFPVLFEGENVTWELSNQVWLQLEAVANEPDSYEHASFKITRKGTGFNTAYIIQPAATGRVLAKDVPLEQLKAHIKELAEELDKTPRDLAVFYLAGPGKEHANGDAHEVCTALIPWLEEQVLSTVQEPEETPLNIEEDNIPF